jgi:hypothetical protein
MIDGEKILYYEQGCNERKTDEGNLVKRGR